MSNLWKALRDVSRDVDPTVGFEAPAPGSGAGSPAPDGAFANRLAAVTGDPEGRPDTATVPASFQQTDLGQRPLPAGRPRPVAASPEAPNGRSTSFPSALRRRPLGGAAPRNGADADSGYLDQVTRLSQGANGDGFVSPTAWPLGGGPDCVEAPPTPAAVTPRAPQTPARPQARPQALPQAPAQAPS